MNNTTEIKKGRGRPSSFDREAMVETIMQLFWDRGYQALSFNEIAKETDLTRASLYNAFSTKEDLLIEALEHYFSKSPDKILDLIKKGEPVTPAFYTLFKDASKARASDKKHRGCLVVNCLNELLPKDTRLSRSLAKMFENRRGRIKLLIKQAIQQGELPKNIDPELTSNLIVAFMSGFNTFSMNGASERKLRTMSYQFLDNLGFDNSIKP